MPNGKSFGKCPGEGILGNSLSSSKDTAAHSPIQSKVTLVYFVLKVMGTGACFLSSPRPAAMATPDWTQSVPKLKAANHKMRGATMNGTLPNSNPAYFMRAHPANQTLSWKVL